MTQHELLIASFTVWAYERIQETIKHTCGRKNPVTLKEAVSEVYGAGYFIGLSRRAISEVINSAVKCN